MTAPSPTAGLTSQQRAAVTLRHLSVAMSAGAGCGKTHVLTQRFLSHLGPDGDCTDLSRLVAITYTERAAREMRQRIREACRERLRTTPPSDVDHWLRVCREIDTARISTIHSFCATLLRSHAVEAGLDPQFGLLEEETGGAFLLHEIQQGVHQLLIAGDADAESLTVEFGLERTVEALRTLVRRRYLIEFDEWGGLESSDLARRWEEQWRQVALPTLIREFLDSPTAVSTRSALENCRPSKPKIQERIAEILDSRSRLPAAALRSLEQLDVALEELHENYKVAGTKAEDWGNEATYALLKSNFDILRTEIKKLRELLHYDPQHAELAARLGLQALRVTRQVGARYDAAKRAAALLDFDDLLWLARNLLRDKAEVRTRVADALDLLMVDEFQDTDPMQAEIVRHLCGEALASGKLFLVGDAKQSIYRFRRAEPRVFEELRQQIPPEGRLPLNLNFRSQPAILNFVNVLFDTALGPEYEALEPAVSQLSPEPCIEFLFSSPPEEDVATLKDAKKSAGQPTGTARVETPGVLAKRLEAEWVAARLQALLHDGVPRIRVKNRDSADATLRPAQPGDVAILFRAMSDVRYFEEALQKQQLDYYVVGGKAFYAQQEVYDLANLCQALVDPDDELSLLGVLRSPFFSLTDDALFAVRQGGGSLAYALQQPPPAWLAEAEQDQIRRAAKVWNELRAAKDHLPAARLLNLAIARTGYDAALLAEFLGTRKLANLAKLIDMAREFDKSGLFTLADFAEQLRESVSEEVHEPLAATHPESSDVIRLMSIHQSKGLEFPIAVVADMNRQPHSAGGFAHFDPEIGPLLALGEKFGVERENLGLLMYRRREQVQTLAETLRLLYVATTRAADYLLLSASFPKPGQLTHPWLKLLSSRFDLLTGQLRTAPTSTGYSPLAKYSSRIPRIHVHHIAPATVPQPGTDREPRLPLEELRETVLEAQPAATPPLWGTIPPDPQAARRFTVSQLRLADLDLRGSELDLVEPHSLSADEQEPLPHEGENADPPREEMLSADDPDHPPVAPTEADLLGTLVHAALERVDLQASEIDVWAVVNRAAQTLDERPPPHLMSLAVQCLQEFLSSRLAAELVQAPHCFRELEFLLPRGPHAIVGKIDCLFQTAAGDWVLIDFKTGEVQTDSALNRLRSVYEFQMALYAEAAESLIGQIPARCEIVALRNRFRTLRCPLDAPRVDEYRTRAEAAIQSLLQQERTTALR